MIYNHYYPLIEHLFLSKKKTITGNPYRAKIRPKKGLFLPFLSSVETGKRVHFLEELTPSSHKLLILFFSVLPPSPFTIMGPYFQKQPRIVNGTIFEGFFYIF